ncbi:magnesium transporter MgtE [Candidatus Peregrinibacteria bacterium CG11_big_fil_rev_8_21_14_0_20_46_8]|nr:MAG: magnesium transporter MgtE [Candidatus Peregrinibacteria bacterium CG11_big_fil_rev_8_21_14_0_20_46_8]
MHQKRVTNFKSLPLNEQAFKLLSMSSTAQTAILRELSVDAIVKMIGFLDEHRMIKIIRHLGAHKKSRVVKKLKQNFQEKIEFLFKFDPKSAAGLMNLNYIEVDMNMTVDEIFRILRKHERATGKIPTVLATSRGYLSGEIPINHLMLGDKNQRAAALLRKIPQIHYNEHEHNVINLFKKHPHGKVVVLDEDKSIIGIIYTDDVLHVLQKQTSKSLRKFAGVNVEEDICDGPLTKVRYRYKWLINNLFTAFLAAAVVGIFENTISRVVILAAYLPIVAGMGGNAATQTLAVTVRGIALGEIDGKNARHIVKNEVIAGVINGLVTGAIAACIALLLNKSAMLGLVLAAAMVANLFIAGFFGTIIPLIMVKLKKDPASSATIFITTATDVFGFLAFLGLATVILL